jgi:phospholipase C
MGIRNACPLPYELYGHGMISDDRKAFQIAVAAGSRLFGAASAGSPFYVYMYNLKDAATTNHRDYAVRAGDQLTDRWILDRFEQESYELRLHGPNGFYRAFRGNAGDPLLDIRCSYPLSSAGKPTGNLEIEIRNRESATYTLTLADESYGSPAKTVILKPNARERIVLDLSKQYGWYDISLVVQGKRDFRQQFAGHVETMQVSKTDPLMGGLV